MNKNLNIYRASAGSGKTFRLTGDYISLLFAAADACAYRHILSVTFTNKATDEMKQRIIAEIHKLSRGEKSEYLKDLMEKHRLSALEIAEKAGKLLVNILHDYSAFQVSTIDSFFQQVIRAFARETGLSGNYALELDTESVLHIAVDKLFDNLAKPENQKLLEWLTDYAEQRIENSQKWNAKADVESLGQEIFKENYQYKSVEIYEKLHNRNFLKNYQLQLNTIKTDFEKRVENEAKSALKIIENHGLKHEDFSHARTRKLEKILAGEYELGVRLSEFADDASKGYTSTAQPHLKSAVGTAHAVGLQQNLLALNDLFENEIIRYNTARLILKHLSIFGIMTDLAAEIKKLTSEQNAMVISDTNLLLSKIIDNSETPFVYEKTGSFLQHFLIDEFQDTSHLQWQNFSPLVQGSLASGNENLIVGDVKQSIYRWRNSNWKLLDSEIIGEIGKKNVNIENLLTNWRSHRNIVEFNNRFFKSAVKTLQNSFDALSKTSNGDIAHAYEALEQNVKPDASEGYVNFCFLTAEKDADEKWKDLALARLPALLEDLQQRGFAPSDVAILVRTNSQANDIVRFLLQYKQSDKAKVGCSYDIMGSEGILLSAAHSVNFIVALLRLVINPADKLAQLAASYEYLFSKNGGDMSAALAGCFCEKNEVPNEFSPVFSSDENARLMQVRNESLFTVIDEIIGIFNLNVWQNEMLFIQGFQDLTFKYISGKNADIRNFLDWWDTVGVRQSITAPENRNTFRIMTVHKSKGLDFKVVILPFCEWKMDEKSAGRKQNILWCKPKDEPFNQLPLLPLDYSKILEKSAFRSEYFDEMMQQYIDNLNVAYVAFTRAREEFYSFSPQPKSENPKSKAEKTPTLSSLLYDYFINRNCGLEHQFTAITDENSTFYSIGEKIIKEKETSKVEVKKITVGKSFSFGERLAIRRQTLDFHLQQRPLTENRRNYGIVMHDILRKIRIQPDQTAAIDAMLREGRINLAEKTEVEREMAQFWTLPSVKEWFSPDAKIINERDIITPENASYRPDRIVISGGKTTVIDYKFGDTENPRHNRQISRYMNLLVEMGFENVEGFVCYCKLKKFEKV